MTDEPKARTTGVLTSLPGPFDEPFDERAFENGICLVHPHIDDPSREEPLSPIEYGGGLSGDMRWPKNVANGRPESDSSPPIEIIAEPESPAEAIARGPTELVIPIVVTKTDGPVGSEMDVDLSDITTALLPRQSPAIEADQYKLQLASADAALPGSGKPELTFKTWVERQKPKELPKGTVEILCEIPVTVSRTYFWEGKQPEHGTLTYSRVLGKIGDSTYFFAAPFHRDERSSHDLEYLLDNARTHAPHRHLVVPDLKLTGETKMAQGRKLYSLEESVRTIGQQVTIHKLRHDIGTEEDIARWIYLKCKEGGQGLLEFVYDPKANARKVLKFAKHFTDPALTKEARKNLLNGYHLQTLVFHDDPEVMDCYGLIEIDGQLCTVMDYAPMHADHLFEEAALAQRYGDTTALTVAFYYTAEQINRGVRRFHRRGVFHGDIKPSNVLFTGGEEAKGRERFAFSKQLLTCQGPQVKLIDLDGAQGYEDTRRTDHYPFSKDMMEPQVLLSQIGALLFGKCGKAGEIELLPRIDAEYVSDVYSTGLTLLEAVAKPLDVALDQSYLKKYEGLYPQVSFIAAKVAADRTHLANVRAANKEKRLFHPDIFDLIETSLKQRQYRPEIEDVAIELKRWPNHRENPYAVHIREHDERLDPSFRYQCRLYDRRHNPNHTLAAAIEGAVSRINSHEGEGWLCGRVVYKRENGQDSAVLEMQDLIPIWLTKRFTDPHYPEPDFAEPEQYLTHLTPLLFVAQDPYWERELRLDLEEDALIYSTAVGAVHYLADALGVQLQHIPRQKFTELFEKNRAMLRQFGTQIEGRLPHEVRAMIPWDISGYLGRVHERNLEQVYTAGQERYDTQLLDLIRDMHHCRRRRPSVEEIKTRALPIMRRYATERF